MMGAGSNPPPSSPKPPAPPNPPAVVASPEFKRLLLENARLKAAAKALVDKMTLISNHPSYKGVFVLAGVHGSPYVGPDMGDELEALRAAVYGAAEGER